jgi:hypothetical protein
VVEQKSMSSGDGCLKVARLLRARVSGRDDLKLVAVGRHGVVLIHGRFERDRNRDPAL